KNYYKNRDLGASKTLYSQMLLKDNQPPANLINKKNKDFERSDALRDELASLGITIMDTADGTLWEKVLKISN
ncbi:MAG TPA: hypothetical protein EYP35_03245, partial [Desulfobacterales bacterium]|nr:hypothetical protein [Desulfobacterales bacterium]